MKFQVKQLVKLIVTAEKVMILSCIPKETPGYNMEGYLIRTPNYSEIFVRDYELEEWKDA